MPTTSAERLTLMFRAFSDRTRLRILHLLTAGELCVGDIVGALQVDQPTISRHLGYLRRARLVSMRKQGLWVFYSLAPANGRVHKTFVNCLGSCFEEVPELAADARRAKRIRASGGCCPPSAHERPSPRH